MNFLPNLPLPSLPRPKVSALLSSRQGEFFPFLVRVEGVWEEETLIFPFQGKENVFVIMGLGKRIAAFKYFVAVY